MSKLGFRSDTPIHNLTRDNPWSIIHRLAAFASCSEAFATRSDRSKVMVTSNHTPSHRCSRLFKSGSIRLVLSLATLLYCLLSLSTAQAETYDASSLASFNYFASGSNPYAGLVEYNGNFYGTTAYGGKHSVGTIFEITPKGNVTTVYDFDTTHGAIPDGTLAVYDGKFYGTTEEGGESNTGTVFEFTPPAKSGTAGTVIVMHSFPQMAGPMAGLVLGTDGYFYGSTSSGGLYFRGNLFKISPSAPYTLTTLYNFCPHPNAVGICPDGRNPQGTLVEYGGKFYGITVNDGTGVGGTAFVYTPGQGGAIGTLSTLHSFNGNTEGHYPYAGLIEYNGNFYGTTTTGGLNDNENTGRGTIFKITPSGALTTLYVFDSPDGGGRPEGTLLEYNGNLFGTTYQGGTYGDGTVFEFVLNSRILISLVDFEADIPGGLPSAGLIQYNGSFYGTTSLGGEYYDGTVFGIVAQ